MGWMGCWKKNETSEIWIMLGLPGNVEVRNSQKNHFFYWDWLAVGWWNQMFRFNNGWTSPNIHEKHGLFRVPGEMSWMIFPIIWPSKSWRVLGWVALKTGAFFSDSWYLSLSVLRRRSWKKMKSIWQRPQKVLARAVPIWFSPKTRTLDWPRWAEVEDFFCSCENLLDWICTKKQVVY